MSSIPTGRHINKDKDDVDKTFEDALSTLRRRLGMSDQRENIRIPFPFEPFDPEKDKDEPGEFTRSITYTNPRSKT